MKKRVLISVSDKTNLEWLVKKLDELNFEIVSTGGTYEFIKKLNIPVIKVSDVTGFQEILDGRVKTLHPKIHGGILADITNSNHLKQISDNDIKNFDLIVVNLYPFEKVISKPNHTFEEAIENIDIGGPAMLRSAAKNYKNVAPIFDFEDYKIIISELEKNNIISLETKLYLAKKVFLYTGKYDYKIARYLMKSSNSNNIHLEDGENSQKEDLRYGENSHQKAWFIKYNKPNKLSIVHCKQLQGKQLSYNNIKDGDAAINILSEFLQYNTFVAVKHMNSCGVGCDEHDSFKAWKKCYEGDTTSIFGGIIATNCEITKEIAESLKNIFLEIIVAPKFSKESLEILSKKVNLRLLEIDLNIQTNKEEHSNIQVQSINGGVLFQESDKSSSLQKDWNLVSKNKDFHPYVKDLEMAWKIVKHLKSNAICIVQDLQLIGIGVGQTNRVLATKLALEQNANLIDHAVLASDAFFPKEDSIELISKFNIKAIVQPSGSIKDKDVINEVDKHNIVFFHAPERHFYH